MRVTTSRIIILLGSVFSFLEVSMREQYIRLSILIPFHMGEGMTSSSMVLDRRAATDALFRQLKPKDFA